MEIRAPYSKSVSGLENFYANNVAVEAEFHSLMTALYEELGGGLLERTKMKSRARTREKVKNDYKGDFSRVVDIWGGSLIFQSEEEILNALEKLKDRDYVIRIKDKWTTPDKTGYRDINMNLRLSDGTIVELQLHHEGVMKAKNWLGHLLYEFMRKNEHNKEMAPYVEQVSELSRIVYQAGLERDLNQLARNEPKWSAQALEISRRLSSQTSTRGLETLVSELGASIRNTLGPSSSATMVVGESSRNSTANGTSSPFSKYRNNINTSERTEKFDSSQNNVILSDKTPPARPEEQNPVFYQSNTDNSDVRRQEQAEQDIDKWLYQLEEYNLKNNARGYVKEITDAIRSNGGLRLEDFVHELGAELAEDLRQKWPAR